MILTNINKQLHKLRGGNCCRDHDAGHEKNTHITSIITALLRLINFRCYISIKISYEMLGQLFTCLDRVTNVLETVRMTSVVRELR